MTKITARLIEDCRRRFEAGDKTALLDAIDFCARSGTVMPVWLAEAYCTAFTAWATYKAKSLDQAFDVGRKGKRIGDRQKREALKPRVVIDVVRLHKLGLPIDEMLFARVGRKLKIGAGQARAIYYEDNPWRQFNEAIHKLPKPVGLKKRGD